MSGTEAHSGDGSPTRQPRQSRIHSVGLPVQTSLLPEPPPGGSGVPPPIPRRHSATPAVAPPPIPLRPPAIPKRSKNEKPIPILLPTRQDSQTNRRKASDPTPSAGLILSSSWNHESSNEKLIDLGPFQTQDQRNDQEYSLAFTSKETTSGENDFVVDFDKADFLEDCKLGQKSNFEELQKASRDLEKSLHERIVKSNESSFKDKSAREGRSRQIVNVYDNRLQSKMEKESDAEACDEATDGKSREKIASLRRVADTKFPALIRSRGEAEKKFKFEELQAASRKLERRLHEEDDENSRVNKENRVNRFEELQRATQDLERRLHSDQKSAEALTRGKYEAEMDKARNILQHNLRKERNCEKLEKLPKATQTNLPPPLSTISQSSVPKPMSVRQDSNVSSDSFSQTSSPSYTSKTMEAPLLPHKYGRIPDRALVPEPDSMSGRTIIKSTSTPASLQAIVRVHGSGGSLRHRIIRDTSHYVPGRRLRFRFMQLLFNAIALLIIAGFVAIYLKSYPETVIRLENKTIYTNVIAFTEQIPAEGKNPAPGVCLPIIVTFCQYHKIPYNFTVFPNEVGNFGQIDAQHDLQLYYGSVINVGCYELAALFLCSIFVPKCGPSGRVLQPCRSLCFQTNIRCGFFFEMFGLGLPDYMDCESYVEDSNPDECVGHKEVQDAIWRSERFVCVSGFQCDKTRCIPVDWRCDGHVDCEDRSDEYECGECITSTSSSVSNNKIVKKPILAKNTVSKSHLHCGNKTCIQASHICDGVKDCPWGQDERYCLRLSERNEDIAEGRLEVYHAEMGKFMSACIPYWNANTSKTICSMLGYTKVVSSSLKADDMNITEEEPNDKRTLLKEFQECITDQEPYPTVTLTCSDYACGRRKPVYGISSRAKTRIVGGVEAAPGDWPFLAALLGGPEEIFYCAGVLIADQWVLTASHCVGNLTNITGWTIQLGITRRYSHSYLGQKVKIRKVIPHPKYNVGGAQNNDVALFKLKHRVPFHEHLRPVCLPEPDMELPEGMKCTVIGWGKKNDAFNSEYEPTVNEVEVPVLDSKTCRHWLADKIRTQRTTMNIKMNEEWNITDGMFCAGYEDGGKDACQGDSGGPLLCRDENDDEKWFVGGIVSWGIKCGHPKLPGVYAYVPKYVPWIRSEMAKTSDD